MRRLTIFLLILTAVAVWTSSGSREHTPPGARSPTDMPEEGPTVVPEVVSGDTRGEARARGADGSATDGAFRVSGTVRDVAGRGVAGATVTEIHADGASTVTDQNGRFELEVSKPDPTLRIEAAGFAPRITGEAGGDLELLQDATITGRVTDHADRPVEGANVFELRDPGKFVLTDGRGEYRFEGARTRQTTILEARYPGHLPGQSRPLNLQSGAEITGLDLVVRRAARIRGRVVPWPGTGAVPTTVWVEGPPRVESVTRDGDFLLEPVGVGSVVVHASTPEGRVAECRVDVPEFGEAEGVELRLGAVFTALVLDDAGDPVHGLSVAVRCIGGDSHGHRRVVSRMREGRVPFGLPFAEEWEVSAEWFGGGTAVEPFRVEPSEEPLILRAPRPAAVSGRVLKDGKAVRGFTVSIQRPDGTSGTNGRDGEFRAWFVPPGPATIRVFSAEGWSDPMEIVLRPGEDRGGLEFEILPGRFVVCRVTDKTGMPALGADLTLRSALGTERKGTWVPSAGFAYMIPAEPGRHTLQVYDTEGKLRAEREIEVEVGENTTVTIQLKEKW